MSGSPQLGGARVLQLLLRIAEAWCSGAPGQTMFLSLAWPCLLLVLIIARECVQALWWLLRALYSSYGGILGILIMFKSLYRTRLMLNRKWTWVSQGDSSWLLDMDSLHCKTNQLQFQRSRNILNFTEFNLQLIRFASFLPKSGLFSMTYSE